MSGFEHIAIEDRPSLRIVTIARPRLRNALATQTMRELDLALREAGERPDIAALVLTGAPPAFCAGSDLKELGGLTAEAMGEHEAATARVARSISSLVLPVIAAVEGYALGGGCILAASCDVVISARDARWALPEVANGWLPPWGLDALVARIGPIKALSLTWGVFDCDGAEAHRLGLADAVSAPGEAIETAIAVGERLAALPPHAVGSAKRFYRCFRRDAEAIDTASAKLFVEDAGTAAAQAVLARFAGKS